MGLRHPRRARVEYASLTGKETGMRHMPFAAFAHNQAWLEVSFRHGFAAPGDPGSAWTASLRSPSLSGSANTSCTSPGARFARAAG